MNTSFEYSVASKNVPTARYSPFEGPGGARRLFADPKIRAIAAAHNKSAAQVVQWQSFRCGDWACMHSSERAYTCTYVLVRVCVRAHASVLACPHAHLVELAVLGR